MRVIGLVCALLAAQGVQAQMYKCVDDRGRVAYSDKPSPKCANARSIAPPTRATPTGKAADRTVQRLTPEQAAHEKKYAASRCKTLKEEEAWLLSPRGSAVEAHDARLGQVRQALAACS